MAGSLGWCPGGTHWLDEYEPSLVPALPEVILARGLSRRHGVVQMGNTRGSLTEGSLGKTASEVSK